MQSLLVVIYPALMLLTLSVGLLSEYVRHVLLYPKLMLKMG